MIPKYKMWERREKGQSFFVIEVISLKQTTITDVLYKPLGNHKAKTLYQIHKTQTLKFNISALNFLILKF